MAGFLTIWSQTGETNPRGDQQRAWLFGFCNDQILNKIVDGLEDSGLLLLQGWRRTWDDYRDHPTARTSAGVIIKGQTFFSLEIENDIRNKLPDLPISSLPFKPHHLTIFDPEWCRNTLWSKLASALECRMQEKHGRWSCVVCGNSFKKSDAWCHDTENCTP
jgi:hypothetical protein